MQDVRELTRERSPRDWSDDRGHTPAKSAGPTMAELKGGVIFASIEEQAQRTIELLGDGALVVTLPPVTVDVRGHLGAVLEELVERELALLGAPSPFLAAWSAMPEDAQARLADQLFRARTVGATGLAMALGSLQAIAKPTLTTDDSATLRWLASATDGAPLVLLVDDSDLYVLGHRAPVPLGTLLARPMAPAREVPSVAAPAVTTPLPPRIIYDVREGLDDEDDEIACLDAHADDPIVTDDDLTTNDTRVAPVDVEIHVDLPPTPEVPEACVGPVEDSQAKHDEPACDASETATVSSEAATTLKEIPIFIDSEVEPSTPVAASIELAEAVLQSVAEDAPSTPQTSGEVSTEQPALDLDLDNIDREAPGSSPVRVAAPDASTAEVEGSHEVAPVDSHDAAPKVEPETVPESPETSESVHGTRRASRSAVRRQPRVLDLTKKSSDEPREEAAPRDRAAAKRVSVGVPVAGPSDTWRSWAIALSAAKGAQPLVVFERLFAESYVPLANAIARGLDDPRALRAYDDFRRTFERAYTDSFATFGATNRRPRLVMDAYDIAAKQARLVGARTTQLIIVDSMRLDVGCMIRDVMSREAAGVATLTSELLLWSALPTTTMRQLETFARGLDALRAPARLEEPIESLRGRSAEIVRRMRVGSRELHKLDIIPATLEGPSPLYSFPEIAEDAGQTLARHLATLNPRTFVLIIGDHGFSVGRRGEIRAGGASPEEVLVPAFGWLIGDLH